MASGAIDGITSEVSRGVMGKVNALTGAYRKELLAGRVRWRGATLLDSVWHFTRTRHELVGLFCSHREHPLARDERVSIFVIRVMFRVFASWISALATDTCSSVEVEEDASEDASTEQNVTLFLTALMVSAFTKFFGIILKKSATLDDVCCGGQDGGIAKNVCTWGGRCCMCVVGFIAVILCIVASVGLSDCPSYDAADGVYVFFLSMA